MMNITSAESGDRLLHALSAQLEEIGASYELVVVGGSALLALGLVTRPTQDVDVVALRADERLESISPFPQPLERARDRVARDFQLPTSWLNDGPAGLLRFGLPEGFLSRAERRDYGTGLTVWYASRFDQIHFKLYAAVDQGPGKHESDLRALSPSGEELVAAARWSRLHDPSAGYLQQLTLALATMGVTSATLTS